MKKFILIPLFILITMSIITTSSIAGTISPGLEEVLDTVPADEEIPVIMTLADTVDLKALKNGITGTSRAEIIKALLAKAEATQGPLLAAVMRKNVKNLKKFWIINGVAFQATPDNIRELASLPGIDSVRLDATVSVPEPMPAAAAAPEWNISAVHAPELWSQGYTGQGIVIASMDTGVDPEHQDISGKWRGGTNSWLDLQGGNTTPYDGNGHGTQTMGIMVGGDLGGSAIGMAPDAQWIAVRIFDSHGQTTMSIIHQGFQWLLDPDGKPGTDDAPDVVNNSWGFETNAGECITEFQPDIETLKLMGIGVVFSGGNRGPYLSSSVSPANNPGSFSVGAVDNTLAVTYFSSRGPSACDGYTTYPELVAPGAGVRTADLTYGGSYPDSYMTVDGTSFATPHVAGAMALLLSAAPTSSLDEIETALVQSAVDLGDFGPDYEYGNGLLDVAAAYDFLIASAPMCTDNDGDGFFVEGGECGIADCNDSDVAVNPDACDIKGDGIDQDCDGFDRLKGKPCPTTADSGGTPGGDTTGVEGKGKTCSDGLDNDGDSLIDCYDPDCSGNKSCR